MEDAGRAGGGDYLLFSVGGMSLALPLSAVEKVELAVELTPLPEAPSVVSGAIDWRGKILPALSMRRRLGLPERELAASDRMVIARSSRRLLALVVDEVLGVSRLEKGELTGADSIYEGLGCVAWAARTADGIVLIHDLELYLSEDDERALEKA
jgi:purine-binding chemotaxis protein CheW